MSSYFSYKFHFKSVIWTVYLFNDAHKEKPNSAQVFIKVISWLFLTFPKYLRNQIKFHNSIELLLHSLKAAPIDTRYFSNSKSLRDQFTRKNFNLIWQVVFKLVYEFVKKGRIPLLSLNELGQKLQATIILGKFHFAEVHRSSLEKVEQILNRPITKF